MPTAHTAFHKTIGQFSYVDLLCAQDIIFLFFLPGQKHRVRAIKRGIGLKSGSKVVLPIVAPADSASTAAASLQAAAAASSSLTSSSTGEMTSTHPSSEAGSSDDSAVVVQSTSPPTG